MHCKQQRARADIYYMEWRARQVGMEGTQLLVDMGIVCNNPRCMGKQRGATHEYV